MSFVVGKAWTSFEFSVPLCAVLSELTWGGVSVPTWVSVRLAIDVVVRPLSWMADSLAGPMTSSLSLDIPLNCVVVRPPPCRVTSVARRVVVQLPSDGGGGPRQAWMGSQGA